MHQLGSLGPEAGQPGFPWRDGAAPLSEFVQDLRRPGPQYQRQGASPLIERQPLRF